MIEVGCVHGDILGCYALCLVCVQSTCCHCESYRGSHCSHGQMLSRINELHQAPETMILSCPSFMAAAMTSKRHRSVSSGLLFKSSAWYLSHCLIWRKVRVEEDYPFLKTSVSQFLNKLVISSTRWTQSFQ